MYGYRARIGALVPSLDTAIEPEFNDMMPEGISVHFTRLPLRTSDVEHLTHMADDVSAAAKLLADAGVDIIAYVCTTGSFIKGVGWDQELITRIEEATGIPATTTSTAVLRAFKRLGINKIAIASPYTEEINNLEKQFLEAQNIRVVSMEGLKEDLRKATPEATYNLACEVNTAEADAIFITCAGFKSITVIEKLENKLQKYVISSNTATMWDILKKLGIKDSIRGYGKLFEN